MEKKSCFVDPTYRLPIYRLTASANTQTFLSIYKMQMDYLYQKELQRAQMKQFIIPSYEEDDFNEWLES